MTVKLLTDLGFIKNHVTVEESGDLAFDYYTLDIGDMCLISDSIDYKEDTPLTEMTKVYIFEYESFEFSDETQLVNFISCLKNNLKIQK